MLRRECLVTSRPATFRQLATSHLADFRRPDFLLELCRRREVLATFLAAGAFREEGAFPEEALRLAVSLVEVDSPAAEVRRNQRGLAPTPHK